MFNSVLCVTIYGPSMMLGDLSYLSLKNDQGIFVDPEPSNIRCLVTIQSPAECAAVSGEFFQSSKSI